MKTKVLFACLTATGLGFSQTYTFTHGTATGNVGPTQVMMDAEYLGTTLDGSVTVTGGIQFWTVPVTGPYQIEAFGGQGYGDFGGRGAHISGEFTLTAGTVLKVLVGQQAGPYLNFPDPTYNHQFGGGGGSFITDTGNTPLIVAGGGGGNHGLAYLVQCDGQITEGGAPGSNASIIGDGGTNGSGGFQAVSADGGGGILSNGDGLAGGQSFLNGGLGGIDEGTGGFGCGGGTSSWNNYRGGGGGGYSGGGGANNSSLCCPAGGGGGSYNGGANAISLAGVQLGNGQVVITLLCTPTALTADLATLSDASDACRIDSLIPPTASNTCGNVYDGTPDVTFPITTVGTTVVTWTYDDGTNTTTQAQNVIITGNDVTAPVADLATLPNLSDVCSITPPTPTATDFCEGSINGVPDLTFPITANGTTVVTWSYDDGNGNISTQTQSITLSDSIIPVADNATLSDEEGCVSVSLQAPTASDNCAGTIVGTPDVALPITTPGLTVVTWSFDDGNGNVITQTQNVTVFGIDNSTSVSGATISANATGLSYQWIDCQSNAPISGETNQTYTASVTGEYAVVVSDSVCSDTSACTLIDFSSLSELNSDRIHLFPNPTSTGIFTVDFDGNIEEIIVIDALGRNAEIQVELATGSVDGSRLATGKYIVKVITSSGVYTKALVVIE